MCYNVMIDIITGLEEAPIALLLLLLFFLIYIS